MDQQEQIKSGKVGGLTDQRRRLTYNLKTLDRLLLVSTCGDFLSEELEQIE
jgi:hypothetical protein